MAEGILTLNQKKEKKKDKGTRLLCKLLSDRSDLLVIAGRLPHRRLQQRSAEYSLASLNRQSFPSLGYPDSRRPRKACSTARHGAVRWRSALQLHLPASSTPPQNACPEAGPAQLLLTRGLIFAGGKRSDPLTSLQEHRFPPAQWASAHSLLSMQAPAPSLAAHLPQAGHLPSL